MAVNPVAAGPSAHASLADAIDHLLNRGAVLAGDATLSVAGVDLVYVGLNLLVSSVETLQEHGDWPAGGAPSSPPPSGDAPPSSWQMLDNESEAPPAEQSIAGGGEALGLALTAADSDVAALRREDEAPDAEIEGAERPLARLVLTLVELLRQVVERQALRRMEGGSLSEEQVERMGRSLMELAEKMTELRAVFGLEEADLTIDLGPLGRLL